MMRLVGRNPRRFRRPVIAALAAAWLLGPATLIAASISQGYKSNEDLAVGTIVVGDEQVAGTVVAATPEKQEQLKGVVVSAQKSLLELSSGEKEFQVATSGASQVIVSTLNGDIKVGDKIAVSPIKGTGMKATLSGKILGVAQADFNSSSKNTAAKDVVDKNGNSTKVNIGLIPVSIEVAYFVAGEGEEKTIIPKFIQDLTNSLAKKRVSPIRIIISGLLLILVLSIIAILIYGAVRSSIISIGRNPLSQSAVRKSLTQVLFVAAIILLVTLGAIYLIISR